METKEMIERLRYKANNIKAKIEPEFFNDVADALEKQIAKFVECKGWKGYRDTRYKCPSCKKIIRCGFEYCSNCGQAVKFPKTKLVDNQIELDWSEADGKETNT